MTTLTNGEKLHIIRGMTQKVYASQISEIVDFALSVNDDYWNDIHIPAWGAAVKDGIKKDQIPNLIKQGVVRPFFVTEPYRELSIKLFPQLKSLFSELFSQFPMPLDTHSLRDSLCMEFKSNITTNKIPCLEMLGCRHLPISGHPIERRCRALLMSISDLLTDISDFQDNIQGILSAVRTVKQLEGLFPEGVEFLPEPPEKKKNIIPVSLLESVRGKLRGSK